MYLKGLVFFFSITSFAVSAASVFKITHGDNTLYLGGTMHVLAKSDYPLPAQYKKAYQAADTLVFETDISAMSSPEIQRASIEMLTYTNDQTLEDTLSQETIHQLKAHLSSRSVPYESFLRMKPALACITLTMIEFNLMGVHIQGVDAYYHMMAMGDGKSIKWFEQPLEQLSFIEKLGATNSDEYIRYTLNDIENIPESLEQLKVAWRTGDLKLLERIAIQEWKEDYPELFSLILSNRNDRWMSDIKSQLATPETEFVLVGALHLAGDDGLIKQLEQAGYKVEQMQ